MSRRPKPPPGQAPALVWAARSPRAFLRGFAGALVLAAVLFTLANGDLAWAASAPIWLALVVLAALFGLVAWARDGAGLSAGADWFRGGGSWVKISKLTRIRFVREPRPCLHLEDSAGRALTVDLLKLSAHPPVATHLRAQLQAAATREDLDLDAATRSYLS